MMNKVVYGLSLIVLFSFNVLEREVESVFNPKKSFEITTLIKSNDYPSSEKDISICEEWNLDRKEVRLILNSAKLIVGPEWHHDFDHLPCRIHGIIRQNGKDFEYSINGGSWCVVDGDYYGIYDEKLETHFISHAWRE